MKTEAEIFNKKERKEDRRGRKREKGGGGEGRGGGEWGGEEKEKRKTRRKRGREGGKSIYRCSSAIVEIFKFDLLEITRKTKTLYSFNKTGRYCWCVLPGDLKELLSEM